MSYTPRPLTDLAITLDEYRRREAAGEITRPITDPAIGGSRASQMRRKLDAEASAAFGTPTLLDAITEHRRNVHAAAPCSPQEPRTRTARTQTPDNAQKGTQDK